ncbi:unnamed protein product [Staurois parvus]|uniref:Uncharacterized protein n=1 Tax=Staurois parvus TaxID=386267 RepID=A0ABN9AA60_9NEOB|nr:unnamed protein product [Staurois parvus]
MPVIDISLLPSCHTSRGGRAGDIYTDHQGSDDQCSPSSATCQCPSMPHISAHLSCLSVSPISAIYQCQSV